jgi:pyridoxine 5-phosphate synthase
MPLLGVNIDHVATVRQARRASTPDVVSAARAALTGGADSITVHLREDRRHILDQDVSRLSKMPGLRLNLEMAATEEMIRIARVSRPDSVCLVPEKRQELTTEGGLDVAGQMARVRAACQKISDKGIHVSLFIAPDVDQVAAAKDAGADFIEIHTGGLRPRQRAYPGFGIEKGSGRRRRGPAVGVESQRGPWVGL